MSRVRCASTRTRALQPQLSCCLALALLMAAAPHAAALQQLLQPAQNAEALHHAQQLSAYPTGEALVQLMYGMLNGTSSNEAQYLSDVAHNVSADNFHELLRSVFYPVKVPLLSGSVLYVQQYMYGHNTRQIYRQRLYQLTPKAGNASAVTLTIWLFKNASKFVNAWENPSIFHNLSATEIHTDLSCRVYWGLVAPNKFHSWMGDQCIYNISGMEVRILDDNWLTESYVTIHERWYLLNGTKVYGLLTPFNETKLPVMVAPVWPTQWHAGGIYITGTQETSEVAVDVIDGGSFYYDWQGTWGRSAMLMRNITTGQVTRDVDYNGTFSYINDQTGSCFSFKVPGVNGPAKPDWVRANFQFDEVEYLYKYQGTPDATFAASNRWTFDAFGGGPNHLFNYWQQQQPYVPSRIMGPSLTHAPWGHSFIELWDYAEGTTPNWKQLFHVPSNCSSLDHLVRTAALRRSSLSEVAAAPTSQVARELAAAAIEQGPEELQRLLERQHVAGWVSPLMVTAERDLAHMAAEQTAYEESVGGWANAHKDELADLRSRLAPSSYPLWPVQFTSNLTGNGISFGANAPVSNYGNFYYDSTHNRSASTYYFTDGGSPMRQVFENQYVYHINMTDGACHAGFIPGGLQTTGPVMRDWIKNFVRHKDEYRLQQLVYYKTEHWTDDAFVTDPKHAFNYWHQISNNLPYQVLGPGPATPPFGHAFLHYGNITLSVDDSIFDLPASCHTAQAGAHTSPGK